MAPTTVLAYCSPTALLALRPPTTVRTSTAHLALRAVLHAMLAWPLRPRGSLPLRALSLGRRRSVFPIYPIVVSGRLHLDIRDIVVGHFLLDGFDMLDQPVWAPDRGHRMRRYIRGASGCAARGGGRPEKTSRSRSFQRARETLAPDWYTYVTTWHFVNFYDCWHIRTVKSPAI